MSAGKQPGPPRQGPRPRQAGVDATAVRRLAARRARTSPAPRGESPWDAARDATAAPATTAVVEGTTAVEETQAVGETVVVGETAVPEAAAVSPRPARPALRLILLVTLAVTTLLSGGLAAWFGTEAGNLDRAPSAQNQALANPGETSKVTSQVTTAINALFSYNYASPGTTTKAAGQLLTGAAVKEYATLFAEVRQKAPKEKLVLTTRVSHVGVELLTPSSARVLVFATESDGSTGVSTPSTAAAMLAVNVILDGGSWKISGIDTFSG
ncbi:MAG TPA: hypothetical protein VMG38_15920 [Trebonia sp.]|nr:hypothetical protein [Trebonia sp.]